MRRRSKKKEQIIQGLQWWKKSINLPANQSIDCRLPRKGCLTDLLPHDACDVTLIWFDWLVILGWSSNHKTAWLPCCLAPFATIFFGSVFPNTKDFFWLKKLHQNYSSIFFIERPSYYAYFRSSTGSKCTMIHAQLMIKGTSSNKHVELQFIAAARENKKKVCTNHI